MQRLVRFLFLVSMIAIFYLIARDFAEAATCTPVYGGGENCVVVGRIEINKEVLRPGTDVYVDNLSRDRDPRYLGDQVVTFKITVKNTGDEVVSPTITDTFPNYITFFSGPGSYNQNTRALTFQVFNLNPNESREFIIYTRAFANDKLPTNQGINCLTNTVKAVAGSNNAEDNAQFCIERRVITPVPTKAPVTKGGIPVKNPPAKLETTPPTGPEMLPLMGLIPAGISGFFLRRKSK